MAKIFFFLRRASSNLMWKDMQGGLVYWTVLCYHPYLVSMLFADLLSLHLVTFYSCMYHHQSAEKNFTHNKDFWTFVRLLWQELVRSDPVTHTDLTNPTFTLNVSSSSGTLLWFPHTRIGPHFLPERLDCQDLMILAGAGNHLELQ